jgi:hypothetical protein
LADCRINRAGEKDCRNQGDQRSHLLPSCEWVVDNLPGASFLSS